MNIRRLRHAALIALLLLLPLTVWAGSNTVANSPQEICPLLLGSPVPELPVQTLEGKPFDLNAAIKSKPTVLIYFRGGW